MGVFSKLFWIVSNRTGIHPVPDRIACSSRLQQKFQGALVMITLDTHELRMKSRDAQFNYPNPKGLSNHHI